jgi:hypothetical protein
MRIHRRRLVVTAVATAGVVAAIAPATASAVPGDPATVTLSASARASTVTVTIHNTSGRDLRCALYGKPPGTNPLEQGVTFSKGMGDALTGGGPDYFPVAPGTSPHSFTDIPAGEYVIDWGCTTTTAPGTSWGTAEAMSSGATTQPTRVAVTAPPPVFGSLS